MIELNQLEQLIYIAENKTISKAAILHNFCPAFIGQPATGSFRALQNFCCSGTKGA